MSTCAVLSVIVLTVFGEGAEQVVPKLSVDSEEVRLAGEIARRLPGWWFLERVDSGRVKPDEGPEGEGLHLVLWELPRTYDEFKAGKGDRIHLYWMAPGYKAESSSPEGKTSAIRVTVWHGWLLIAPADAPKTLPDLETRLASALQAADHDPVFSEDGCNVYVGRVSFQKIHINTSDENHGFYFDGQITDRRTGKQQSFYVRPWSHSGSPLEGGDGKDYLLVGGPGNDDWAFKAVVPLKR